MCSGLVWQAESTVYGNAISCYIDSCCSRVQQLETHILGSTSFSDQVRGACCNFAMISLRVIVATLQRCRGFSSIWAKRAWAVVIINRMKVVHLSQCASKASYSKTLVGEELSFTTSKHTYYTECPRLSELSLSKCFKIWSNSFKIADAQAHNV